MVHSRKNRGGMFSQIRTIFLISANICAYQEKAYHIKEWTLVSNHPLVVGFHPGKQNKKNYASIQILDTENRKLTLRFMSCFEPLIKDFLISTYMPHVFGMGYEN